MSVDWADIEPRFAAISRRLAALEEQMAVVCAQLDLPYESPGSGVPPEVVALVRQGKTLEAIKEYRARLGGGLEEAKRAVAEL